MTRNGLSFELRRGKNGMGTIRAKLYFFYQSTYWSLGFKINNQLWDSDVGRIKLSQEIPGKDYTYFNEILVKIEDEFKKQVILQKFSGYPFNIKFAKRLLIQKFSPSSDPRNPNRQKQKKNINELLSAKRAIANLEKRYIKAVLKKEGFPYNYTDNEDIIDIRRLIIKTRRELKTIENKN